MKQKRFTEEQKAFALRQADSGVPVAAILRKKPPRRRVACRTRRMRPPATRRNESWSMDFVSDRLFDGRRLQGLALVDNHTRESLALHVGQRVRGMDVVRVLEQVVDRRGRPASIRVDNGPEFVS